MSRGRALAFELHKATPSKRRHRNHEGNQVHRSRRRHPRHPVVLSPARIGPPREFTGKVSAFQIIKGLDTVCVAVDSADVHTSTDVDTRSEAKKDVGAMKGIVMAIFAPAPLLTLIGGLGVARRRFGRGAAALCLIFGLIGLGIGAILKSAAEGDAGIGMTLLLLTGVAGVVGGMAASSSPSGSSRRPHSSRAARGLNATSTHVRRSRRPALRRFRAILPRWQSRSIRVPIPTSRRDVDRAAEGSAPADARRPAQRRRAPQAQADPPPRRACSRPALDDALARHAAPAIVDCGAGKSYLGALLYELVLGPAGRGTLSAIEARAELVASRPPRAPRASARIGSASWPASIAATPTLPERPNVVTALHACDTATDDALVLAIARGADHVAVVPCCQAEVARQLETARPADPADRRAVRAPAPPPRARLAPHERRARRSCSRRTATRSPSPSSSAGSTRAKNELILGKRVAPLRRRGRATLARRARAVRRSSPRSCASCARAASIRARRRRDQHRPWLIVLAPRTSTSTSTKHDQVSALDLLRRRRSQRTIG